MKLEILQENLSKGLAIVSRVIPVRPVLPVLGNIYLCADNNAVTLIGGNGETTIQTKIGAKVTASGKLCVPVRTLTDLVNSLGSTKIDLEGKETNLTIKTTNFVGKINGLSAEEYPLPHGSKEIQSVLEINTADFKEALSKVIFSVALDESRPALTGVLFTQNNGSLRLVATDAYRLSLSGIPTTGDVPEVIVPSKALNEIIRLLETSVDSLKMTFSPGEVTFELGETKISSRLIAATFPTYEKIIPAASDHKLMLDTERFLQAVKTASIFARDNSNIVRLKITPSGAGHKILLLSAAASVGEQEEEIAGEFAGNLEEEMTIAFNFHYLLDVLGCVRGDFVQLEFSGPLLPVVFKEPNNNKFLHIIMPVRVQN